MHVPTVVISIQKGILPFVAIFIQPLTAVIFFILTARMAPEEYHERRRRRRRRR